jgi:Tfp pilus assembly protein PilF
MKKICLLMVLLLSGCVTSREPASSPGVAAVQNQAIAAYGRGVQYMGEGRYLLARQQFSEAATMAVTGSLYNDAVAGMDRADAVLKNRRQYHE